MREKRNRVIRASIRDRRDLRTKGSTFDRGGDLRVYGPRDTVSRAQDLRDGCVTLPSTAFAVAVLYAGASPLHATETNLVIMSELQRVI